MKNPRLYPDSVYQEYMKAYDNFYKKRLSIFGKGCPRLDSQFSESIAADYVDFDIDHKNGVDGHNSKGESYEVKGTGYTNTKVRFNSKVQADHIIWVKAVQNQVMIYEMDLSVYQHLDSNGFVDLSKETKTQKGTLTF